MKKIKQIKQPKYQDAPVADVMEVKHGYWFCTEYDYFDCSVCGEAYYNGCESTEEAKHRLETRYDLYKYCPYCGARMDINYLKDGNNNA